MIDYHVVEYGAMAFVAITSFVLLRLANRRVAAAEAREDISTASTVLIEPVTLSTLDACRVVLESVAVDRRDHPGVITWYDDIVSRVWSSLPEAIRGHDTQENRAEFASAVRAAIRLHDECDVWMRSED